MPLSPYGRVSFESLFEATKAPNAQESAKKKFSVILIHPKNPTRPECRQKLKEMFDACQALSMEKFGVRMGEKKPKSSLIVKSPFRDGSEKEHLDGYDGDSVFVRYASINRPTILGPAKETLGEGEGLYNGCIGHASYSLFSYDMPESCGIGIGLNNFQKVADGEAFGSGGANAEDEFGVIEGAQAPADTPNDEDTPF